MPSHLHLPAKALPFPCLAGLVLLYAFLILPLFGQGQRLGDYLGDETVLYAETKQINQFFRRFNCEESPRGIRYYENRDSLYHDAATRKKYLRILFDLQSPYMAESVKEQFIQQLTQRNNQQFLDFYGDDWFAEVKASFMYFGKRQEATFFLKLQSEPVGYKWVFTQVYFEPFEKMFLDADSLDHLPPFIHPLSHELDFMIFRKVFKDQREIELYTSREFHPDHLTLFLYEIKRGNITFLQVDKLKFHFLQIKDWYFELSLFNRSGNNRGWLISQLINIPEDQKRILLKYIYHE